MAHTTELGRPYSKAMDSFQLCRFEVREERGAGPRRESLLEPKGCLCPSPAPEPEVALSSRDWPCWRPTLVMPRCAWPLTTSVAPMRMHMLPLRMDLPKPLGSRSHCAKTYSVMLLLSLWLALRMPRLSVAMGSMNAGLKPCVRPLGLFR